MTDIPAAIVLSEDGQSLSCRGDWVMVSIERLEQQIKQISKRSKDITIIDGSQISHLDSAGAMMLEDLIEVFSQREQKVRLTGLNAKFQALLNIIAKQSDAVHHPPDVAREGGFFRAIGVWTFNKYTQLCIFLAFVGEFMVAFYRASLHPKRIQWRSMFATIDLTGYQAMPIIALMSFLVGIVLAYQLGVQLREYGANIFIVDFSGIAILREFGPLITSIVIAGRTSTSFAALIGTMKLNEEIDALHTMGISPLERLVLPRIFGLVIALPLLVVWADVFGILGSMVMAKGMLGIGYHAFLERFTVGVSLSHYVLGMIKTPVFALIIAAVGCFQGFQVGTSAESVGHKTTAAAVQAIFLIIIADAGFSMLFNKLGY